VTNGARGTVVGIMLNPKEPPPDNTPIVKLRYLPSYVLVKLDRTRTSRLQGLEEGVIHHEDNSAVAICYDGSVLVHGLSIPRTDNAGAYR